MPFCCLFAIESASRERMCLDSATGSPAWWRIDAKSEAGLGVGVSETLENINRESWWMCSTAGGPGTAAGAIERPLFFRCAQDCSVLNVTGFSTPAGCFES